MIVIPPKAINDLNLSSSSVTEPNAPADYSSGTTYAKGDMATDSATKLVYLSLQAGNHGNTPESSPLFWEVIGYKEVVYNPATAYLASTDAAPVYALYQHRIYEALQASTGKNPYANPDYWADIGPSLQFAMFDTIRGTAGVGASPLTVVITPGERVNALAVLAVEADSVRVEMTAGGSTVYDQTATLRTRSARNWYDYFFKRFSYSNAFLFQGVPAYANGQITVTFTRAGGYVKCGALCVGTALDLGITQPSPENDLLNFSKIDRDDFGNAILNQKLSVPKTTQTVLAESSDLDDIIAVRKQLNAVPAVWAGLTDNTSYYFPSLLILGFYTQFKITLQKPKKAMLALELQEVG